MLPRLLIVFILAGLVAKCASLKCYSCMSSREGNCEDESQMETKECDTSGSDGLLSARPVCTKVVKEIRGFDHITRSCGFEGSLIRQCDSHKSAEHCSVCDSNLCNSSTKIILNLSLFLTATLVVTKRLLL